MITKLRTSFLLPAELSETTSKYINLTEQAGVVEPYVQKLLVLLKGNVQDLNKALTRLTVNSKVEATAEADGVRDDLMIINKSGITIRLAVDTLRVMGRATQGVRLIKLSDSDEISSVAKIEKIESDEEEIVEGDENATEGAENSTEESGENDSDTSETTPEEPTE